MSLAPRPDPLDLWIAGQSLGLGARLLRAAGHPTSSEQRIVFGDVWPVRDAPPSSLVDQLIELPVSTLEALAALSPATARLWSAYLPAWTAGLAKARWDLTSKRKVSPIAGARILAHHIGVGRHTGAQLVRLANLELGREWTYHTKLPALLETLMTDLRAAGDVRAKLNALTDLRRAGAPARWRMVENFLIQELFAWPLLLVQAEGADRAAAHCTLPVGLEVVMDGASEVRFTAPDDGSELHHWGASFDRALAAAKNLWALNHRAWPPRFRQQVAAASLAVDLSVASAIFARFRSEWRLRIEGPSHESYFALVILGRLLGDPAMETVCATGRLGEIIPDNESDPDAGANYHLGWVDGAQAKVESAQEALFDQVLVPAGSAPESKSDRIKVGEGKRLSDYADHAFGDGWRRHRWVRCPDLAERFRQDAADPIERDQIEHVRRALRASTSPVLRLPVEIPALSVVKALRDVNRDVTLLLDRNSLPEERLGSFTFVRVPPKETGERFWRVVWDAIRGDPDGLEDLCDAVSLQRPAERLKDELNRYQPTPDRPTRAPDVLVIMGTQQLNWPTDLSHSPEGRLQIDVVTRALGKPRGRRLWPTFTPCLGRLLGATRIILIPESEMVRDTIARHLVPRNLIDAVQRLSVFEHGFSFATARKMLGVSDTECADILRELRTPITAGGPELLGYAASGRTKGPDDASYEYFLRRRVPPLGNAYRRAALHDRAAHALVDFLDRSEDTRRFDVRSGLRPVALHEAQNHLAEVARLRKASGFASVVKRDRLSRIAEPFSWSVLRWAALQGAAPAPDLLQAACDELDRRIEKGGRLHPSELVWTAKLAYRFESDQGQAPAARAIRDRMLKEAWDRSQGWSPREQEACRFIVATTRASMNMRQASCEADLLIVRDDNHQAALRLGDARDVYDFAWFELAGDAEDDDVRAAHIYGHGFLNEHVRGLEGLHVPTMLKYVGACWRAGLRPTSDIFPALRGSDADELRQSLASKDRPETGLAWRAVAQKRWLIGYNKLHNRSIGDLPERAVAMNRPAPGRPPISVRVR